MAVKMYRGTFFFVCFCLLVWIDSDAQHLQMAPRDVLDAGERRERLAVGGGRALRPLDAQQTVQTDETLFGIVQRLRNNAKRMNNAPNDVISAASPSTKRRLISTARPELIRFRTPQTERDGESGFREACRLRRRPRRQKPPSEKENGLLSAASRFIRIPLDVAIDPARIFCRRTLARFNRPRH